MSIPHKIYYSQNREDLILAGMLRTVTGGFYVDVGANHPVHDSVTKIFYDKGWSGINVEPDESLHAELCRERPRDINLNLGLSSQPGFLEFRVYQGNRGLSTFSSELKQMYEEIDPQSSHKEISLKVDSLAEVLARYRRVGEIHFLKLDVEGLELEVLLGNRWDRFRPWVVCMERNLNHARRAAISAFLTAWKYSHVFFDGLNDYLVASERGALWNESTYSQQMIMEGIPVHFAFAVDRIASSAESPMPENIHALLAMDNQAFVAAAYALILNRTPDPQGMENYSRELNSGVSKLEIISRLRNSSEGRQLNRPLPGYRKALILRPLQRLFRGSALG